MDLWLLASAKKLPWVTGSSLMALPGDKVGGREKTGREEGWCRAADCIFFFKEAGSVNRKPLSSPAFLCKAQIWRLPASPVTWNGILHKVISSICLFLYLKSIKVTIKCHWFFSESNLPFQWYQATRWLSLFLFDKCGIIGRWSFKKMHVSTSDK